MTDDRKRFFLATAKRRGQKVVVFFRGWHRDCEESLHHWRLSLFRKVYFRADAMVVLAREFEAKLRAWGYQGPIYVETTAVDDSLLESVGFRDQRTISPVIRVLFLGRVVRSKGVYEALEAYDRVRRDYEDIRFTIAGDGEDLGAVRQYVARRSIGGVDFLGYIRGSEKARVLREHDVFLLPTYHGEGMPNAILEAMAVGLPIITRPVGGLKDFFQDGKMGFITEARSPEALARHLKRLVSDSELRRSMGQFNHAYARGRFAASRVASRLNSIYCAVAYNLTQ